MEPENKQEEENKLERYYCMECHGIDNPMSWSNYWHAWMCTECLEHLVTNDTGVSARGFALLVIRELIPPRVHSLYDLCRFQLTACEQQHRQWRGLPNDSPLCLNTTCKVCFK